MLAASLGQESEIGHALEEKGSFEQFIHSRTMKTGSSGRCG